MKNTYCAIFSAFFLLLIVLGAASFVLPSHVLAQKTEITYPQVGGIEPPRTVKTLLPQYLQYMFYLAIGLAGFLAFGALVYGGVKYLTSAGNPAAMSDAQAQISAGLLGIVLLLGSYIFLNTINPKLVSLNVTGNPATLGVVLCKSSACSANPSGNPGEDYIIVKSNLSCLKDCEAGKINPQAFAVGSIYFFSSSYELELRLYGGQNFEGGLVWDSRDHEPISAGSPQAVGRTANSVEITWRTPGVYLFSEENCKGETKLYTTSSASFGDFDNKARSLLIVPRFRIIKQSSGLMNALAAINPGGVPWPGVGGKVVLSEKLGAILHENPNFEGDAVVWVNGDNPIEDVPVEDVPVEDVPACRNIGNVPCSNTVEPYCPEGGVSVGGTASSITVFKQLLDTPEAGTLGDGVTVFANFQYNEQPSVPSFTDDNKHCGPINDVSDATTRLGTGTPLWVDGEKEIGENMEIGDHSSKLDCDYVFKQRKASSLKLQGSFLAILFRKDGRGEMFDASDIRLKDNHIGDNEARHMLVIPIAE